MQILTKVSNTPQAAPCNARPAMSMPILIEVAQTVELRKKKATAARSTGFRPQISDTLAQMGDEAAVARASAEPIHV